MKGEGWGRKINTATDVAMYALHKIPFFQKEKKNTCGFFFLNSAVPSKKQALPLRSSVNDPGKCSKSVRSSTELNVILIAFSFRSQS